MYNNPYPEEIVDEATGQVFPDKEHIAYKRGWKAKEAEDIYIIEELMVGVRDAISRAKEDILGARDEH